MGPTLIVWVFAADDAVVVLVGFDVVGGDDFVLVLLDMAGTR